MEFKLIDIDGTIKTATIVQWYKKVSDKINEGENLLEIVTDKASFDVEAPCSGVLISIVKGEKSEISSEDIIAVIE